MAKIVFKANKNTVTANTYVAHEVYKRNETIVEKLGGEVVRGVGGFKAQFPTNAKAKAFVEQAVTGISKREYNAARKTEQKKVAIASGKGKKAVTKGKGKKETAKTKGNFITLTDENGNTYKLDASVLKGKAKATATKSKAVTKGKKVTTKKATKGKGKAKLTERQKIHKAYEMANNAFKRKVKYSTWKAKYEEILENL